MADQSPTLKDIRAMRVGDLKAALKEAGLPTNGDKKTLQMRLGKHYGVHVPRGPAAPKTAVAPKRPPAPRVGAPYRTMRQFQDHMHLLGLQKTVRDLKESEMDRRMVEAMKPAYPGTLDLRFRVLDAHTNRSIRPKTHPRGVAADASAADESGAAAADESGAAAADESETEDVFTDPTWDDMHSFSREDHIRSLPDNLAFMYTWVRERLSSESTMLELLEANSTLNDKFGRCFDRLKEAAGTAGQVADLQSFLGSTVNDLSDSDYLAVCAIFMEAIEEDTEADRWLVLHMALPPLHKLYYKLIAPAGTAAKDTASPFCCTSSENFMADFWNAFADGIQQALHEARAAVTPSYRTRMDQWNDHLLRCGAKLFKSRSYPGDDESWISAAMALGANTATELARY